MTPLNALNVASNSTGTIGGTASDSFLYSVTINKAGATGNVLVLRQGSSTGTIVATIDTTVAALGTLIFGGVRFPNGIYYSLSTGTAADITINYR